MRDTIRALVDELGPGSCQVMTLRGGNDDDQTGLGTIIEPGRPLGRGRVPTSARALFLGRALRHSLRAQPDVIICGHPHLAPVAWACSATVRAHVLMWVYGKESWTPLPRLHRASLRAADLVMSITQFTADQAIAAQGLERDRVRVVPLAVTTERQFNSEYCHERDTVLSVARLNRGDEYKGVDKLVLAWPEILRHHPGARLRVVGGGNDIDRLRQLAQTLGVHDSIEFLGRVSDEELDAEYGRATLFALPGRARLTPPAQGEGFGLVFIEAGAYGLPAIAGRAGGAIEAVDHGVTGLLVDPHDVDDIASAIVRLLGDAETRLRMGSAAVHRSATRFSYERFAHDVVHCTLLAAARAH
jgi:glycosyltransferase involved in cell wall biosynthesis